MSPSPALALPFAAQPLGAGTLDPARSRIAVLGAGVMGPGIALTFAEHGFEVDLCETTHSAIDRGMASLEDALRLKEEAGLIPSDLANATFERVRPHVGSEAALASARLVIEAVTENADVKRAVYAQISQLAAPDTIVWSNTSTMNVFALADEALRTRLLVAHWFAPPHILPLVEVVGEPATLPGLVDQTLAALRGLGKAPVRLNKFVPGFVINRLQRALGREAFYLLDEGVISAEDLDVAVRTSLSPRMQLLGLMQRYDYTGLTLSLRNLADPAMTDAPLDTQPAALVERVERGELGVSSGKGFYDYHGRSLIELQRERDEKLWRIMRSLGDFAQDPKPI
ncbi:3-hydroxyacyl-CoA dehydrogenase family protein [Verticiella sediminum]|uniref:L-gulonate 3-dehydrogenase n=1 Tax=Verticiella sediminum TaxID=1247510 RepID=A0A556B0W9_9BURK|nr:3-hydroxyacyl-CoA dehydrogenase family protein [Verticiella sediminum]TSH98831.1 3-hydroxyacyl-CoA dehydrogenase family protein [Verticiella sediminum]